MFSKTPLRVTGFCLLSGLSPLLWAAPAAFSTHGLSGWQAQDFKGRVATHYQLTRDDDAGAQVLHARCTRSASGYVWKEHIDLRQTPRLHWRWRIEQVYAGLHERDKRGDDFPARIYVVRDGGWMPWRTLSLVYVWGNGEAAERDWPDAYTRQAHIIVVRSGNQDSGHWQDEQRDVWADFQRYFGAEVEAIDAVALMSDCDDSERDGAADYGDLFFGP